MTPQDVEIERYVALYHRYGVTYRTSVRALRTFRSLVDERPDLQRRGLLDIGAGHGSMLETARDAGYSIVGTEVVPSLCMRSDFPVVLAPAWDLPFAPRTFGTVTCFDVLEHLLPDDVPSALSEIARVARDRILVQVSCCPSRWMDDRGQLHMTLWDPSMWDFMTRSAWAPDFRVVPRTVVAETSLILEGIPVQPLE